MMKNIIEMLKEGKHNVEDLTFKNMKMISTFRYSASNELKIFEIERELKLEEKIQIIDAFKDNIATYMIELINKWDAEKDSLPQDQWGTPKTNSKKAWIKRNDNKNVIDKEYKIGSYNMFGDKFKTLSIECPTTENGYSLTFSGEHVANQWFHGLCLELKRIEEKWFAENDPLQVKINKVKQLGDNYREVFNCKLLNDIVWNRETDVTDEQLDIFINAYKALEDCVAEQTRRIEQVLGSEIMYKEE